MNSATVLLAGASGLVGQQLLRLLSRDAGIAEVRALARRPLPSSALAPGAATEVKIASASAALALVEEDREAARRDLAVSYTHLTLPTN